MKRSYAGAGVALVTPFTASGDLDEPALRRLVRSRVPDSGRIYVSREWLEAEGLDDAP